VVSSILIVGDGAGKAVRSPSKTVLLASAASAVGRSRGFAVHKALDRTGSLLGPLAAAGVISFSTVLWPAFAIFVIFAIHGGGRARQRIRPRQAEH
jgi:hypothetical protein